MTAEPKYPPESYYDVLGVPATATRGEIRWAYLRKIKGAGPDEATSEYWTGIVNGAYEVLLDKSRRAEYDAYLAKRQIPTEAEAGDDSKLRGTQPTGRSSNASDVRTPTQPGARPPDPSITRRSTIEPFGGGPRVPSQSSPQAWSHPQRRKLPVAGFASVLVVVLIVGLICWGIIKFNDNSTSTKPAQTDAVAAEQAAWRAPAILQAQNVADAQASAADASVSGGHLYYTLYLAHNAGVVLVSLNAATGQQEWRYQGSGQTPSSDHVSPPVRIGDVVVGYDDSSVFGLDATSGQLRWTNQGPGSGISPPIIVGDVVVLWYHPTDTITAYRADTGAQVWTKSASDLFDQVSHVSSAGTQLLVLRSKTLESWNIKNGRPSWRKTLDTPAANQDDHGIAIGGSAGGLVVVARFASIEARRLSDGSRAWRVDLPPAGNPHDLMVSNQAALVTTCADVFPCSNSGPVRTAYDPQSGRQLWQEPAAGAGGDIEPTRIHVAWLAENTVVQWQAYKPRVWLVDVRTGKVTWSKSLVSLRPASVAGDEHHLYVVDLSGAVLATNR